MTQAELIAKAKSSPGTPRAQARELVRLAEANGTPFTLVEGKDLGPCNEAGSSQWARNERLTYRLPGGSLSTGWVGMTVKADVAEELLS